MYITINHCLNQLRLPSDKRQNELNAFQIVEFKKIIEDNTLDKEKKDEEFKKILNSHLICIIEEPEQNLFPVSQYNVLMNLLSSFSDIKDNTLIITTHSPYVLETINNCMYANQIAAKGIDVSNILPSEYHISFDNVAAYKIVDGKIISIKEDDIKQINPQEIDKCSETISDIYTKLADAEYGATDE